MEDLEKVMKEYDMTEDEAKEFVANKKSKDTTDNKTEADTEPKQESKDSAYKGEKTITEDKVEEKVEEKSKAEETTDTKVEDKVEDTISETDKQIDYANKYNYESVCKELEKVKELNASYIARIEKLESVVNQWGLADSGENHKSFGLKGEMRRDGKPDKGYDPIKVALDIANKK